MTAPPDRSTLEYFQSDAYRRILWALAMGREQRRIEQRRYEESDGPWRDLGGEA